MRFLPKIGLLSPKKNKEDIISHLGDVIRPKQFLQHRYKTLKTSFTHEELLELTEKMVKEKIFDLKKELLFFGSYFDVFPFLVKSDLDLCESKKNVICIFSPFLYLEEHYNFENIRSSSSIRFFIEYLKKKKICNTKIIFLGTEKKYVTKNEKIFLEENKEFCEIHYSEKINLNFIKKFLLNLKNEKKNKKNDFYFGFSFNVIDQQFFWGRNHISIDSNFDNKLVLYLFRELGNMDLKLLSFFDFNPQAEDTVSGVFYSTIIFEYLAKKLNL